MRAIIPAAGVGNRLLPLTQSRPKGLVEVGGRPILAYTLELLHDAGISEVICVSGYRGDLLERELCGLTARPPLRFVRNPHFASTNSIISLAQTIPWWDEEFCVIDSDMLFTQRTLHNLLSHPSDAALIDGTRPAEHIDVRVEIRGARLLRVDKTLPLDVTSGEFVNLSRWTPAGASQLAIAIEKLLAQGRSDVLWERAIEFIAECVPISPIYVESDAWVEVDTWVDLAAAEQFIAANKPHGMLPHTA